ncbi:hypothetical protein EVAR_51565_1 [Eumeta japonica]|uniref:Uncharacterized protein n=1 Tax=Eumeta variegata TaxID=151549 RepID=A0A4C1Z8P9_EUMVA|nr:hypothetical protein EVAR_51565_1 [Eumeta japonica]
MDVPRATRTATPLATSDGGMALRGSDTFTFFYCPVGDDSYGKDLLLAIRHAQASIDIEHEERCITSGLYMDDECPNLPPGVICAIPSKERLRLTLNTGSIPDSRQR